MSLYFSAQELKERIDSNDNRCTAKPYLLLLQEKRYMYSNDGDFGGDEVFFLEHEEDDPREFNSLDELKDYFRSEYMDQGVKFQYKRLFKKEYFETTNVFLTDKGYEDHLAINRHNLISPQSYGIHAWRNKEIASLYSLVDECLKLQKQNEIMREALKVAANQLEGISLGIQAHGRNINVRFFIETSLQNANSARQALKQVKEIEG